MKNLLPILFAFLLILSGCMNSDDTVGGAGEAEVTYVVKTGDPKTVATLEIDGMHCEMACGGKIRKELESVEGVSIATIDYEDERPLNQAVITYDPSVTDEKALIQTVNQIADGKLYSVKTAEVVTYEKSSSESSANTADEGEEVLFDVQRVFRFPDVFHLLDKLIR